MSGMGGWGGGDAAESDALTSVGVVKRLYCLSNHRDCAVIFLFFFVFGAGMGLLLSGDRQMVSMDGSLLNWLAALLIPLHATLT